LLRLFDHRFDAFAGETHENLPPRAGVALGAGAVALMLLPWQICALWTGTTLGVEVWGWFAGRRQYRGLPVTALERGAFLIYVTVLIACWFLLGAMFWLTGDGRRGVRHRRVGQRHRFRPDLRLAQPAGLRRLRRDALDRACSA